MGHNHGLLGNGIQIGWRLYLIGFFLGVIILMTAYLKDYLWVLILLGVLAIAVYIFLHSRKKRKVAPETNNE